MRASSLTHTMLALALAALPPLARAADDAEKCGEKAQAVDVLSCYSVDLSIPDTPGLAIVGLGSEVALRPTSPRALGMAVQQGLGPDGKPRQGLAFDIAPMKLLSPGLSKEEYKGSRLVRALWNSQLSFGVGKPTSDADKSTHIGLGLSSVVWRAESSDPLLDEKHRSCLGSALQAALPQDFPGLGPAKELAATEAMKVCYAGLADRTWNGSALLVGIAQARITDSEVGAGAHAKPRGIWVSYGFGFEGIPSLQRTLHLTATLRSLRAERVVDPLDAKAFVSQDSRLLGAKLFRRGSFVNAALELSVQRTTISGRASQTLHSRAFGVERKISDNLWLVAAFGSKRGSGEGSQSYVTTGLKFGTATESAIKDR